MMQISIQICIFASDFQLGVVCRLSEINSFESVFYSIPYNFQKHPHVGVIYLIGFIIETDKLKNQFIPVFNELHKPLRSLPVFHHKNSEKRAFKKLL